MEDVASQVGLCLFCWKQRPSWRAKKKQQKLHRISSSMVVFPVAAAAAPMI